jgi:hypothetical protein
MQGHIFECFDEQRDRKQFTRTREMVGEYVKKHLKYPEDLSPLFGDTIGTPTVPRPQPLAADKRIESLSVKSSGKLFGEPKSVLEVVVQ